MASVFCRLQKLDSKLIEMHQDGSLKTLPFHQRISLFKCYKRYLKKLLKTDHPVTKALSIFAISMLLYSKTDAQVSCKIFKDAPESNPLKRIPPVNNLISPAFVDIDGDGDLDCYSIYRVPSKNHSSYDSIRFSFIKNVGSATLPVFEPDGTGGFPASPDAFYVGFFAQEGPVFADIDGDGDYDCFLANYTSRGDYRLTVEYFENIGDKNHPVFVQRPQEQNPLSFVTGYRALLFNLVDIDGDGDLDLFTFESYYDKFYLNKGTKNNPDFVFVRDDRQYGYGNRYFDHYVFLDWNKDGLIDEIPSGGGVFYTYVGKGEGHHFMERNYVDAPQFTGSVKAQAMVDLNNDGFLEVVDGNLNYAVTSPVATIKASGNNPIRLDAYPKGEYKYQWLRNREIIQNATSDFIEVSQPGEYIAEITGNCGTGISLPYDVTINTRLASLPNKQDLSAMNVTTQMQLYPNPFTAECVLQFSQEATGNMLIRITDEQGRVVTSFWSKNNTVRFGKELARGIYFIQVMNGSGMIFRQKLVKQ